MIIANFGCCASTSPSTHLAKKTTTTTYYYLLLLLLLLLLPLPYQGDEVGDEVSTPSDHTHVDACIL